MTTFYVIKSVFTGEDMRAEGTQLDFQLLFFRGSDFTLPLYASFLATLLSVPDQEFTAWLDDTPGSVKDLPVTLKGHDVLVLLTSGTVYIPHPV